MTMSPSPLLVVALAIVSLLLLLTSGIGTCADDLPRLNIDPDSLTTSGLSAGAFAAVQFHFAYSSVVKGAGVVAGGPFYCARDQLADALTYCMNAFMKPSITPMISAADTYSSNGDIDNVSNLWKSPVWLFSGTKDSVVRSVVMHALEDMYRHYGANITTVYNIPAEHCMPTNDFGASCGTLGSPYINNCNYDAVGALLQRLYGTLAPPSTGSATGSMLTFDQGKYAGSGYTGLADQGYVYVPLACKDGANRCKLHVSWHGCSQAESDIGTDWIDHAGYNKWADTNQIVILYPQAQKNFLKSNPQGCFDWWGYTDKNYATKKGVQNMAVQKMVEAITGN